MHEGAILLLEVVDHLLKEPLVDVEDGVRFVLVYLVRVHQQGYHHTVKVGYAYRFLHDEDNQLGHLQLHIHGDAMNFGFEVVRLNLGLQALFFSLALLLEVDWFG